MLQPDDGPQFATAKQVFNTNYNGYTPAVIVTPTSQLDVQKAMAFAAANNLKVAPRGGGQRSHLWWPALCLLPYCWRIARGRSLYPTSRSGTRSRHFAAR